MPWFPIYSSGVDYQFTPEGTFATATLGPDSVIRGADVGGALGHWELTLPEAASLRITTLSYSDNSISDPAFFTWEPGSVTVVNEDESEFPTSFLPSQFTVGPATSLRFDFGYYEQAGSFEFLIEVETAAPQQVSYNCDCDDDYPRTTLLEMRKRVMRRIGFSVQAANPPPGMADLIDDFIRSAQELLFRRYSVFRRERFYIWDLVPGTRFYDLDANADECTKRLDPRMVSWAGISQGDGNWRPLVCGIDPVMYTARGPGIPSHYEIRQCIELWPAPNDATWKLRVKGQFGLAPLLVDTDVTTVEPEAIFMLAVANAKAHYGQPDAGNYASQLTAYVRDLIRGSHHTRRYLPGRNDVRNAVRPIPVGGWPEDT